MKGLFLFVYLSAIFSQADHTIEAGNFFYTPSSLTINAGETVEWYNVGGFHDVNGSTNTITGSSFNNPEDFNLSAVSGPGSIGTYTFNVAGTYNYDCSIGAHAANGMVGSITVLESSQCEEGYSFYEGFNQNTTIVFDGSNCFYNSDLEFLQDLIDQNNLDFSSPLDLGTQNWLGGRLLYIKVGNDFDGGNVVLTVLPESIGNLSQVQTLSLGENNIGTLPASITSLGNLANLILSFNSITTLPEDIGSLSSLYFLDLGYNQLEFVPSSIGDLTNLEYLWLFDNNLSSLPDSICNLNLIFSCSGEEPCVDALFAPYFGCGGNMLCAEVNIPECVLNSNNFEISLDVFYYSFIIDAPQVCEECVAGDVNNDETINILDVVSIVQYVLNNVEYSDEQVCSADINADETVNILDIVALVQLILGG